MDHPLLLPTYCAATEPNTGMLQQRAALIAPLCRNSFGISADNAPGATPTQGTARRRWAAAAAWRMGRRPRPLPSARPQSRWARAGRSWHRAAPAQGGGRRCYVSQHARQTRLDDSNRDGDGRNVPSSGQVVALCSGYSDGCMQPWGAARNVQCLRKQLKHQNVRGSTQALWSRSGGTAGETGSCNCQGKLQRLQNITFLLLQATRPAPVRGSGGSTW